MEKPLTIAEAQQLAAPFLKDDALDEFLQWRKQEAARELASDAEE